MICDFVTPAATVLLPALASLLAPYLCRHLPVARAALLLALVPAVIFVYFLFAIPSTVAIGIPTWRATLPWMPSLGIHWDLWVTPVGLILALLVSGVGIAIAIYAGSYLKDSPKAGRFFPAFFLFMAAMLGLAVTENLMVLFVFWELTSVASYILIGFYHEKSASRLAARDALLITGAGGLALLAGFILLGEAGSSFRLGELTERSSAIADSPLYPAIFLCILAGAVTKSAQAPLHFWLPGAMTAPAPVSAYLHSATMVKAGVFLLAILHPVLGGTSLWHFSLIGFGTVTMTWAALVAMAQTDLKRLLAYTTISTLGTLTMLLGVENALGAKAAVVLLIVHALYKGSLFMVAGILEKATGTRDVSQLGGLMRSLPALGLSAALAAASMSGLPPFVGFIAKELLYEVKLETPLVGWPLLFCGFVAGAANIVVALKVGVAPFFGKHKPLPSGNLHFGVGYWLGPAVLGAGSLLLGIFPDPLLGPLVAAAVTQIRVETIEVKLALWHGFNLVFLLSALTILAGVAVFAARHHIRKLAARLSLLVWWDGQTWFRALFDHFLLAAGGLTSALQSGRLTRYLAIILCTAVALLLWAFWKSNYALLPRSLDAPRFDALIVAGLVSLSALGAALAARRMTAILSLGCAGFGIAALFALFGAPDLAITQVLVETLTLALFALAIYGLPSLGRPKAPQFVRTLSKTLLPGAVGILFAMLTLKALDLEFQEPVSRQIALLSVPEGHGRNVVNVILVDFRSLDTLGEGVVLAIAAFGVAAILGKALRPPPLSASRKASAVLISSARYTAPAMMVFSIYLLLRGHNEPGGGFIGGLMAGMAAILSHLALPLSQLRLAGARPSFLITAGLALCLLSGLPGLFLQGSFLAAWWGPHFFLPLLGKIKLGSPLVFDAGIFLVVAGAVMTLFRELSQGNLAARKRAVSRTLRPWN